MKYKFLIVFVFLVAITDFVSAQCAMCKKMAGDVTDEVDSSIGEQLNSGILYLLIIPYIILFIVFRKKIFHVFNEIRKAARH